MIFQAKSVAPELERATLRWLASWGGTASIGENGRIMACDSASQAGEDVWLSLFIKGWVKSEVGVLDEDPPRFINITESGRLAALA